jgi:hypothetical protein
LQLTFSTWLLNTNVGADGQSYFHFQMHMPAPAQDSVFPFVHEELRLKRQTWPMKVKSAH